MQRRKFLTQSAFTLTGTLAFPAIVKASYLGSPNFSELSDGETLTQARKNIEKVRKSDVVLQFLDKHGQPFANQPVEIKQLSHEFLFGDNNWTMATMVRNGMGDSDRLKYYRKAFSELYNSLNTTLYWTERPRNDAVKTQDFQGELQWDSIDESVNWAMAKGLTPKGHPMFWTVPKALPEWLQKYPYETQEKFIEVRIRNLAARYKGRIKLWDAVNEMLWEPHPKNMIKRDWPYFETMDNMVDYISKVLRWGREEDPNALFTINDYGLSQVKNPKLTSHDGQQVTTSVQRKRYIELVNRLGDAGYSPNLMGIQCHTGWLRPTEQMAFYDEMSGSGIPLSVTEFWARTTELKKMSGEQVESEEWRSFLGSETKEHLSDEELEEVRDQFVLDYLTCAFGHSNIHSFYFWGMINQMIDFKDDWTSSHTLKPLYHKLNKLINEEWKTNLFMRTDKSGKVNFRGFNGDYSAITPVNEGIPGVGHMFNVSKTHESIKQVIKTVF